MDLPLIIASVILIGSSLKFYLDEKAYDNKRKISRKKAYVMFFLVGAAGLIMSAEAFKKYIIFNKIVAVIAILLFFTALLFLGISNRRDGPF